MLSEELQPYRSAPIPLMEPSKFDFSMLDRMDMEPQKLVSPTIDGSQFFEDLKPDAQSKLEPISFNRERSGIDRYMPSPYFKDLGFNPNRDNESRYGYAQTWGNTLNNSLKGMFSLGATGFTDGWKGWGRMYDSVKDMDFSGLMGDEESQLALNKSQTDVMNKYAIYATPQSEDTFFNRKTLGNMLQQSGFTLGVLAQTGIELAVTKAIEGMLFVPTGGASGAVAGVTGAKSVSGFLSAFKGIGKGANVFRKSQAAAAITEIGNATIESTRLADKIWKSASRVLPLVEDIKDLGTAWKAGVRPDTWHGIATLGSIGLGGVKRTLSEANLVFSESRMEAAGTYADMRDKLYWEEYDKTGEVSAERLEHIEKVAREAAQKNFNTNSIVIGVSNRIMFDNMFKSFKFNKFLQEGDGAAKNILNVSGKLKAGEIGTRAFKKGMLGTPGQYGAIASQFGHKQALKELGKSVLRHGSKWELTEGLQENIQETSNNYFSDYYYDLYSSEYDPNIKADKDKSFDMAFDSQMNMQGLKTFMSGALTGFIVSGPSKLFEKGARRMSTTKTQRDEQSKNIKDHVDNLNNFYTNGAATFLSPVIRNFKVQSDAAGLMQTAMENNDRYSFENFKEDAVSELVFSSIQMGTDEALLSHLEHLSKTMTKEEFEQAFQGFEFSDQNKKSAQTYIGKMIDSIRSYKDISEKYHSKYDKLYDVNLFQPGSREREEVALAKKAVDNAIHTIASNEFKHQKSLERMTSIFNDIGSITSMGSSLATSFTVLGSDEYSAKEIKTVESELKSLKELTDPESKKRVKQLETELEHLKNWVDNKDAFFETDSENKKATEKMLSGLKGYIDTKNKASDVNVTINNNDINDVFTQLTDYVKLSKKSQSHVEAINVLTNPKVYSKFLQRHRRAANDMAYANMIEEFNNAHPGFKLKNKALYARIQELTEKEDATDEEIRELFSTTAKLKELFDNYTETDVEEHLDFVKKIIETEKFAEMFPTLDSYWKEASEKLSKLKEGSKEYEELEDQMDIFFNTSVVKAVNDALFKDVDFFKKKEEKSDTKDEELERRRKEVSEYQLPAKSENVPYSQSSSEKTIVETLDIAMPEIFKMQAVEEEGIKYMDRVQLVRDFKKFDDKSREILLKEIKKHFYRKYGIDPNTIDSKSTTLDPAKKKNLLDRIQQADKKVLDRILLDELRNNPLAKDTDVIKAIEDRTKVLKDIEDSNKEGNEEGEYDDALNLEKEKIEVIREEPKTDTAYSTTGLETLNVKTDETDPDETKVRFYNTLRNLREKAGSSSEFETIELEKGRFGLFLKWVNPMEMFLENVDGKLQLNAFAHQILQKETIDAIEGEKPTYTIAEFINSSIMVAVDSKGEPYLFNQDGEVDTNGKLIYTVSRIIGYKDGKYFAMRPSDGSNQVQTPTQIATKEAKGKNMSESRFKALVEDLEKKQQKEFKDIYDIRKSFEADKKQSILLPINQITKGQIEFLSTPQSIEKLGIKKIDLKLGSPATGTRKGGIYFINPETKNYHLVIRPHINTERARLIEHLIFEDNDIDKGDILEFLLAMVYTKSNSIWFSMRETNGKMSIVPQIFNKDTGKMVDVINNKLSRDTFVNTLTKKPMNISKSKLDKNFTDYKLVDGKIETESIFYNDFVSKNYGTFLKELNPQRRNAYIKFDVPSKFTPEDMSILSAQEPIDPIDPQEVITKLESLKDEKILVVDPNNRGRYIEVDENGNPIEGTQLNRVSSIKYDGTLEEDRPSDSNEATQRGEVIDVMFRNLINGEYDSLETFKADYQNVKKEYVKADNFSESFLDDLYKGLTDFITSNPDYILVSNTSTLWGEINGNKVAGTVDTIMIHKKSGRVYIVDTKTSSINRRELYNGNLSDRYDTVKKDSTQQTAYSILFEQRTGIKPSGIFILPVTTKKSKGEYSTVNVGSKTDPKLSYLITLEKNPNLKGTETSIKNDVVIEKNDNVKEVVIGDITARQIINKYGATENELINNKTGEGLLQLISPDGTVSYAPMIGKNFLESINKFSGKTIDEQAGAIFSGIPIKDILSKLVEQPKEVVKTEQTATEKEQEELNNIVNLFKRKSIDNKATLEQIEAAKVWWENSDLKAFIPFENMMDIVNSNAIGQFTEHGITLFNGANMTDIYHEAWHGFSQLYLTKEQKVDLYNETKKLKGTFINYFGKEVSFNNATYLEIEEYLAEDFRKYILNNGNIIAKQRTQRNTIFRKILKFLRELFSGVTREDWSVQSDAVNKINELYEKLRTNNFTEYSPSVSNITFSVLNKSITGLSNAESKLVSDSIDSVINDLFDIINTQLIQQGKPMVNISSLFTNPTVRNQILGTVKTKFEEKIKSGTTYQGEVLRRAIDNFDDTLKYYADRSSFLRTFEKDTQSFDEDGNLKPPTQLGSGEGDATDIKDSLFNRSGNDRSMDDMLDDEVKYLISTLTLKQGGEDVKNDLGFNKLAPYERIRNRLTKMLQGVADESDMYNIVLSNVEAYPELGQLAVRLGDPSDYEGNTAKFNLWMKFRQGFAKPVIPIVEYLIESRKEGDDSQGVTVKLSRARPDLNKVQSEFTGNFMYALPNENPYVRVKDGQNVLNVEKLLEDVGFAYSESGIDVSLYSYKRGTSAKLFQALGMTFDNTGDINTELEQFEQKFDATLSNIVQGLNYLSQNKIDIVDPLAQLKSPIAEINFSGEQGNIDKLLAIQAKHSDDYSNFSVINPAGDREWEHSMPNLITMQFAKLNNAEKFPTLQDVLSDPKMSMYDISKNPYMNGGKFLERMFHPDGTRIMNNFTGKFVKIEVSNLSGLKIIGSEISSEGLKTGSLNKQAKFMMDFNGLLQYGTSSTLQHASKSTYSAIKVDDASDGDRNLYYPMTRFVGKSRYNYNFLKDLLIGELTTIAWLNQGVGANIGGYNKYAKEFRLMDNLISPQVKEKLYDLVKNGMPEDVELEVDKFKTALEESFQKYFDALAAQNMTMLDTNLISKALMGTVKAKLKSEYSTTFSKFKDADFINTLNNAYTFNSWVHNVEMVRTVYGDPAFYNLDKDEFHKRIGASAAFKNTTSQSQGTMKYINDTGMLVAKHMGIKPKVYDGTFDVRIHKDIKLQSDSYKAFVGIFTKHFQKLHNISVEEATKLAKEELHAYSEGEIKESDAQGMMILDSWVIMHKTLGNWNDIMESIYQKAARGEELTSEEFMTFMGVSKFQHFGPLAENKDYDGKLYAPAFHKFAVMPLIPSVIKGTALEVINKDMMEKEHDYLTFTSGSKTANVGEPNSFFENDDYNKRDPYKGEFAINRIYTEFLGEQVEMAPKWKNKVIFSTQSRKMIAAGIFDQGAPVDYKGDIELWKGLSDAEKIAKSSLYAKQQKYIDDIDHLSNVLKKRLLKEAGITHENGVYDIQNFEPIVKILHKEFKKRDIPDDIIDFVDIVRKGEDYGKLKNQLDISPYAQKMENIIQAIINNRLIRQKVNGEQLIQVADTGFNRIGFRNATTDEQKKYGSGLGFYTQGKDGGVTLAMEVKVALSGDYLKLLDLTHTDGSPIRVQPNSADQAKLNELKAIEWKTMPEKRAIDAEIHSIQSKYMTQSRERLNSMIKNKEFNEANDSFLTLVGERIPVQGLNSMEFMTIAEFLPGEAGNLIVLPTEIVSKSGGDYDVDKLNIRKPNFITKYKRNLSNAKLRELSKKYPTLDFSKDNVNIILDASQDPEETYEIEGDDKKILDIINTEASEFNSIQLSKEELKNAENNLIFSTREILRAPENFIQLITPNSTKDLKPLADELAGRNIGYNPKMNIVDGKPRAKVSPTSLIEPLFNLHQFEANNEGKNALAITAIDNPFNVMLNNVGAYMNSTYIHVTADGKKVRKPVYLPFNHNKTKDGNISLSHIYDVNGQHKIGRIIEQIMNGHVDVEKDPWIFDINGGVTSIPTILYMLQAGVPINDIANYTTQPAIQGYTNALRNKNNIYDKAGNPQNHQFFKSRIQTELLNGILGTNYNSVDKLRKYIGGIKKDVDIKKLFSEGLYTTTKSKEENAVLLLQYFDMEAIADKITSIKRALNFDTSVPTGAIMAMDKQNQFHEAVEIGIIPSHILTDMRDKSILKAFKIQDLTIAVQSILLPFRNHPAINQFILDKKKDLPITKRAQFFEKFAFTIKNDLIQRIFQVAIFDTNYDTRPWFKGEDTIARQTEDIKKNNVDLVREYYVLRNLQPDVLKKDRTGKELPADQQIHNMKLIVANLTPDVVNDYRDQFAKLIDQNVQKVADPIQNRNLSIFFRKLGLFGFLQSGLNKSHISYNEIIPSNIITDIIGDKVKSATVTLTTPQQLSEFYAQFKEQNQSVFRFEDGDGRVLKAKNPHPYRGKDFIYNREKVKKAEQTKSVRESNTSNQSKEVYNNLGNKTKSENVIIKPWGELKDATNAITTNGVIATRIKNSSEHFGNPFSHDLDGKTQGLIKTDTIKEAVESYIDWVLNSEEPRAYWVRKQIDSGLLKGRPILYYKELGEPSHATALDYLVNNSLESVKPSETITFEEEPTSGYKNRTVKNASADATIAIAVDFTSAGERLTKTSVLNQNKKYIGVDANSLEVTKERVDKIVDMLNSVKAKTLNIAGNGIYTMKGKYTQEQVDKFTYDLLNQIINSPRLTTKIESIRSGGQTGFDEAGTKAGIRLVLPTLTLAPKGWTFRVDIDRYNSEYKGKVNKFKINSNNSVDISDEQQFKARFDNINKPFEESTIDLNNLFLDKEKRIKIDYPKDIQFEEGYGSISSLKLLEATQLSHEDVVKENNEDPYWQIVNELYGKVASTYVGETDNEISKAEGEWLKSLGDVVGNNFIDSYLTSEEGVDKTIQEYAQILLDKNRKLIDTAQLDLFDLPPAPQDLEGSDTNKCK